MTPDRDERTEADRVARWATVLSAVVAAFAFTMGALLGADCTLTVTVPGDVQETP